MLFFDVFFFVYVMLLVILDVNSEELGIWGVVYKWIGEIILRE